MLIFIKTVLIFTTSFIQVSSISRNFFKPIEHVVLKWRTLKVSVGSDWPRVFFMLEKRGVFSEG